MVILYSLGVYFYYILIKVSSLWNPKARLWIAGRRNWYADLKANISDDAPWVWFHCASLGEFEQGRPLIESLKSRNPETKVLVTFFSPSGYEVKKNYAMADHVCYLPLDTPKNAFRLLKIVNPRQIFFVKYEFWYYFLRGIQNSRIPLYLVSGIFRDGQRFFNPWGAWFRKSLHAFHHFFVQNERSAELLKEIGFTNVSVTGDTRFDRVHDIIQAPKDFPILKSFKENSVLIVAGSSWEPEELLLEQLLDKSMQNVKLILAPHQIHAEKIDFLIEKFDNIGVIRFTDLKNIKQLAGKKVIILNTMGMLTSVYQYADIAVVGGAFGKGLHNILEPVAYGTPVVFGPKYQKFQEAIDLVNRKAAFSVTGYVEFESVVMSLIVDSERRKAIGKIAEDYVKSSLGASEMIMNHISKTKEDRC